MFHKRFIISTITAILAALPCIADTGYSARINELIAQKQAKMKQLEKCRGTTKNLKIAGLSTLGITVVGVGANIAEAVILNQYDDKISDAEKARDEAKTKYTEQNKKDCLKLNGDGKPSYDSKNNVCTITQHGTANKQDFDDLKDVLKYTYYDCIVEKNTNTRFRAICEFLQNSVDFTIKYDYDYTISDTQDENAAQQSETATADATPQQQSNEPSEFEKQCTKLGLKPEPFTNYIKCKLEIATTTDLKSAKMPLTDYHKAFKCDKDKKVTCVDNICSLECTKSSKSDTEYDVIEVKYKEITCPIAGQVVQPNGCECKEGYKLSPDGKSCIDNLTNEPIKAAAKKQETKPQNNNNDNELLKKCDGVTNKDFCKRCKGEGVELYADDETVECIKTVNKTITGPEAEKEFLELKKQVYPESKETDYYASIEREIFNYYDKQPNDSKELSIYIKYDAIKCPIKGQVAEGSSGTGGLCVCPKGQILNKDQTQCISEKAATKTAGNNNTEKAEEATQKNDNKDDELTKKCEGVTNKKFCERCKGEGVELVVLDEYIRCDKTVNKTITGPEVEKEFLEFKEQVYPESKNTRFHISSDRRTINNFYDKLPNDSKELVIYIKYDAITCPIKGQVAEGWSGKGGICICPKGTKLNKEQNECIPEKTAKTIECQNKGEIISGNVCVCPDGSKFENNMCVINVTDYKWYKYQNVNGGIYTAKKYLETKGINTKDVKCESEDEPGYFGDDYVLCYPKDKAVYRFQFNSLNAPRNEEKDGLF